MHFDAAMTAMIAVSSVAFLLSDGEKRRLRWVQAMRKYLSRLACVLRYEQPELARLLLGVELRATPQERLLTKLMQASTMMGMSPLLICCSCSPVPPPPAAPAMAVFHAEKSSRPSACRYSVLRPERSESEPAPGESSG